MIYNSILETIGDTKVIKLNRLSEKYSNNIFVKNEADNPFGSIKDRIALNIITSALQNKQITYNTTIIEATSGNTGIAISAICLYYKIKCIIVMPENMSKQRISIMKSFNAQIILTNKKEGMNGAINKAREISNNIKDSFILSQFTNENNPITHYNTTAREIYNDVNLDYFFSSIGTGGTISGCGRFFKEKNPLIKVIGIEPSESAVINKKEININYIQGIGAGFIPDTLDLNVVDEVLMVSSSDAFKMMKYVNEEEVMFCGGSSGACLSGAINYIIENKIKNKNIVLIFPDSLSKYLEDDENL